MEAQRINGEVATWNVAKAYGFISADGVEDRIFAHRSQLRQSSETQIIALSPGTRVTFVLAETAKGLEAFDVAIVPGRVRFNLTQDGQTVVRVRY